ncbi:MAG: transcriptional regulator, MarR family [Actinomycetia bacterium]|nr:transcriptional regulator, MarR family [Actinomycetes bacterium]
MPNHARVDRTANLLGALSLVVTDRVADEISGESGHSDSAATALSAMHSFLERPSIDRLRQVLGLTSSGAVRLVDRLEAAGLVRREVGADARSTAVALTPAGRRAAARVATSRAQVLGDALSTLSPAERRQFDSLISKVIVQFVRGPGAQRWMCRMCDTEACGQPAGTCPVTRAARAGARP